MNRQIRTRTALGLCLLTLVSGCTPTQPYFFGEDGDLSHYIDVATEIEYPDVNTVPLDEVQASLAPLSLANPDSFQWWDLTLEEVTRMTLANSKVMRQLGGRITDAGQNIAQSAPESLTGQTAAGAPNPTTVYDSALVESGYGGSTGSPFSGTGVEAALSEFDTQLTSSLLWQNNDRPQNFGLASAAGLFNPRFRQDIGRYSGGLRKTTADGTTFEARNNINYDWNNNGSRTQPSDWFVNVEAAFTRPLLQGAGTQYNRIAGPRDFQQAAGGFADQIDGVVIARIRQDVTLTQFERGVNDMMRDVEDAYWELYFAYHDLDARKVGLESAQETWKNINAKASVSHVGGEADKVAQSRAQYFVFRSEVEVAQTSLFRVENQLRYLMGLPVADGRLIRPSDEPTTAQVHVDWATVHAEALVRRVELRRQKWEIKRRELELIAARNQMLPRLDAVGQYRWLGAGDELIDSNRNGIPPFGADSNAFESLTSGNFQEWELGLQFTMPLGMRRGLATVRHSQLMLTRERTLLGELEREVSFQMGHAVRDVEFNYGVAQTRFNSWVASQEEVDAFESLYEAGRETLNLLLDAQRRRALAESSFYRSLADYNRAVMRLHYRKGSLLEYNGVYLAEGPWPGKAQFDALRRARQRDASWFMDYGYTRPRVVSAGPHPQASGTATGAPYEGPALGSPTEDGGQPLPPPAPTIEELIPPPAPVEEFGYGPSGVTTASYLEILPAVDDSAPIALPANPFLQGEGAPAVNATDAPLSPAMRLPPLTYESHAG